MRSRTRERTSVTEIGRKSDGMNGTYIFATGRIGRRFHGFGTTKDDNDKIIKLAIGAAKNGAPTHKNHDGILSRQDAVCFIISSILNMCHSVRISELTELFVYSLTFGAT